MASVQKSLPAELVPSPSLECVFHRDYSQGKMLVYSNPWTDLERDLNETLNRIQAIFGKAILELKEWNAIYFTVLEKKESAEKHILTIVTCLNPTLNHFIKKSDLPYIDFLSKFSSKKEIRRECRFASIVKVIKDFEMSHQCSFPHLLFKTTLTDEEEKKLRKWAKGLTAPVGEVHRLLKALVSVFKVGLASIELTLERYGCSIFQMHDPRMVQLVQGMKTGDPVSILGKCYRLGTRLNDPFPVYFSLQDVPHLTLRIDQNKAIGGMEKEVIDKEHSGAPMPHRTVKGAYSLVERCYCSLNTVAWTSSSILSEEDREKAKPLVSLLRQLAEASFTPKPLLPENFGFNALGEIRSLTLMPAEQRSFEEIEDFTWKCTQNPVVFTFLMHESGLGGTEEAQAYQKLLGLALKNYPRDEAVTLEGKIKNPLILNYRKGFYDAVTQLKSRLQEKGVKNVNEILRINHLKHCPGRFLLPNFFEYAALTMQ